MYPGAGCIKEATLFWTPPQFLNMRVLLLCRFLNASSQYSFATISAASRDHVALNLVRTFDDLFARAGVGLGITQRVRASCSQVYWHSNTHVGTTCIAKATHHCTTSCLPMRITVAIENAETLSTQILQAKSTVLCRMLTGTHVARAIKCFSTWTFSARTVARQAQCTRMRWRARS